MAKIREHRSTEVTDVEEKEAVCGGFIPPAVPELRQVLLKCTRKLAEAELRKDELAPNYQIDHK